MKTNIVLTGFMAAGKSMAAKHLAERSGRAVFSTDVWVEQKAGKPIIEIFEKEDEVVFRKLEKEAVRYAAGLVHTIIDCGGGVVLDNENVRLLKETGIVIYLAASPEEIFRRTKGTAHRPLLNTPDPLTAIRQMIKRRVTQYEKADYCISTDGMTGEQMAEAIEDVLARG